MKKALIITDSLGLPRNEYSTEESWVFNFMSTFKDDYIFYTDLKRRATSRELKNMQNHFNCLCADLMIVQLGICDCTRRPFPYRLMQVKNIFFNTKISKFINILLDKYLYFFTSKIKRQDCSPEEYKENIKQAIEFGISHNSNCKIVLLAIGDAGMKLKNKVYGIQEDISQYNAILSTIANEYENVTYLDWRLGHCADDYVIEIDGHHLSQFGQELLLKRLIKEVEGGGTHILL